MGFPEARTCCETRCDKFQPSRYQQQEWGGAYLLIMIRTTQTDSHVFTDDMEEASLLGLSSGSVKLIHSFEIEQAREHRRRSSAICRTSGFWWRVGFLLSIIGNIGLTILVVQAPQDLLSQYNNFMYWRGKQHPMLYGYLYIAQTAGTEINGRLAAQYDHVCGSRGYSLDYYQYNERLRNSTRNHDPMLDSISEATLDPTQNRGHIPYSIMQEIGFEDCDWVSLEEPWQAWSNILATLIDTGKNWTMELHVPCRDPLDHLLALCLDNGHKLDCYADNLAMELQACIMSATNRFSIELEFDSKIQLMCFDSMDTDLYISHLSSRLESKRLPTDYIPRGNESQRYVDLDSDSDSAPWLECFKDHPTIANEIRQSLLENYEYFRWCDECLGSKHDLLA